MPSPHRRRYLARRDASGGRVMSNSSSLTVAQQGFDAWRRGDFDALEAIFAPDVEWRWFEPGDWDCHNRDDVMRTMRQRPSDRKTTSREQHPIGHLVAGLRVRAPR